MPDECLPFLQVWRQVNEALQQRTASIDALYAKLMQGEHQLGQQMRSLLEALAATLSEIAHAGEGEVEHTVEAEALACNQAMLAHQRSFAKLASKLHVAQVQLEKAKRQDFEAACDSWCVLRTRHAVAQLALRLCSPEFLAPEDRERTFAELGEAQKEHFDGLVARLSALTGAPPNMLDAASSHLFVPFSS
jgi:hypothetical protein